MYMIRKGNYNSTISARAKGNTIILVKEGIETDNYTTETGWDGGKIGFFVYSGQRTV